MPSIKLEEFPRYFDELDDEWIATYGQYTLKSFLQPIYTHSMEEIYGYECLIRVCHSDGNTISPLDFFAGLSDDHEVVRAGIVCAGLHIRNFAKSGLSGKAFINVHPNMFVASQVVKQASVQIMNRIHAEGLSTEQIVWEITEFRENDLQKFFSGVEKFKKLGHLVAIDDFGKHASNEERVSLLNPDIVKIDRAIIQEFVINTNVTYLPSLLRELTQKGICTVAESVEKKEEYELIKHLPFSWIQGYFAGKPRSMSHISNLAFAND